MKKLKVAPPKPLFKGSIAKANRWTGTAHDNKREIARHKRQGRG